VHYIFEPGLLASGPVRTALLVGAIVAVTSGIIGVFTVIRGQSFAGHSLADVATTGGSGAFLVGLNQFWGFLAAGAAAAAVMEAIGVQRRRGRDVATGVVLAAALGAAALFLYLGTQQTSTTGASFTVLFGSMFVITPDTVPVLIASGVIALILVAMLARVLLLTSLSADLASARGVNVRLVGAVYLIALAISVSLSAVAIGAILSTALLIGPSATALRLTRSPVRAMAASAAIGVAATWLGIVFAYDSYYWPPDHRGWPVSFFVVVFVLLGYLLTYARRPRRLAPRSPHEEERECGPATGGPETSVGAVHV
jgi:zinc/manganese transport system permease protein